MSLATRVKKLFTKAYPTITARTAQDLLRERRALLLDVRESFEWKSGHAPSARHIPLATLGRRASELPTNRPIVTVCHSGLRSARAAAMLARRGHEVYNLRGGMRAWAQAGLPVSPAGARAAGR
jgi:rhodanese-related sulfurtransferase